MFIGFVKSAQAVKFLQPKRQRLKLAVAAWILGTIIGVPLGVFSATNRGKFLDYLFRGFALLGQSLPIFWVGIVLIFF